MTIVRRFVAALTVLPLVVLAGACTPAPPPHPDVIVYGDSLTYMSEGAAHFFYPRLNVVWRAFPGTAMCDWYQAAAADNVKLHPKRVVLAFTGNAAFACAYPAYQAGGVAGVVNLYEQSLRRMRALYPTTPITIVIPPAMHDVTGNFPVNGSPLLVAMYKTVGPQLGMTIDTAADDWLTPGHVFTFTRPRFPFGPLVIVRTPDGIHLTVAGEVWYGLALVHQP